MRKPLTQSEVLEILRKYDPAGYEYYHNHAYNYGIHVELYAEYLLSKASNAEKGE